MDKCYIVRSVGVVCWRKERILIHIQLAYPGDVTALQIGRNFHYIGVQYRREYKRTSVYTSICPGFMMEARAGA